MRLGKRVKHKISVLTLAAVLLLTGCTSARKDEEYRLPEEKKLIVYSAHKQEIYEPIIKEFEERSGIWVEVVCGGTNELLNRIREEDGNDSCDIMFGGGVDSLEAYSDCFIPYRSRQYGRLEQTYASATDAYTVFSKLPVVFIYNTKLVIGPGAPRSWEELLDSRWQGKIAFADPARSGSSYTALETMIQALDERYEADEVIRLFQQNLEGSAADDSTQIVEDVIMGRKLVGITLEESAMKYIAKGEDIGMIYPKEGTSAVPDGCAIVKNAPHEENAKLFLEFIVGEDVQHLLEDQLFRRSVRKDIAGKLPMKELQYDMGRAEESRDEILETWARFDTGADGE